MSSAEECSESWSEIDELVGDEADGWDLPELDSPDQSDRTVSEAWDEQETSPLLSVIAWRGSAEFPGYGLTVPYRCELEDTASVLSLVNPCEGLNGSVEVAICVEGLTLLVVLEVEVGAESAALRLGRTALSGQVLIDPGATIGDK